MERYLDSLDDGQRTRILVKLLRPGTTVPEENMLTGAESEETSGKENSQEEDKQRRDQIRRRVLEAAAALAEAGEIKRVRSRKDGRIYWLRL